MPERCFTQLHNKKRKIKIKAEERGGDIVSSVINMQMHTDVFDELLQTGKLS